MGNIMSRIKRYLLTCIRSILCIFGACYRCFIYCCCCCCSRDEDGPCGSDEENPLLPDQRMERERDLQNKIKINELEAEITAIREKNEHLSQQLSIEWSKKVSSDESSIENINVKNRPMNIADEMTQLMTQEWLDIMKSLDETSNEITERIKLKFLCDVLLKAEQVAKEHFEGQLKNVYFCLQGNQNIPVVTALSGSPDQSTSKENLNPNAVPHYKQLKAGIGEFLRYGADNYDTTPIIEKTLAELSQMGQYNNILLTTEKNEHMLRYITAVARLVWKMIVQRPPMVFDVNGVGAPFNTKRQELHYNSPNDPNSVTEYYVYPSLLHGTQVMVKGKVMLQRRETGERQNP